INRCADKLLEGGKQSLVGEFALSGFGNPKIDDLGHRRPVTLGHKNIRRFDIPMNDALLMGMLERPTDLDKKPKPFGGSEMVLVTVIGDFQAAYQFHNEIGPATIGGAGVEDPGDIRMIHQSQS